MKEDWVSTRLLPCCVAQPPAAGLGRAKENVMLQRSLR
jgi:hypothetical protein